MMEGSDFEVLTTRRKCSSCKEFCICRSVCKICGLLFCYDCKPFPMTKNRCPFGHRFIVRDVGPEENYRCDICELSPQMIGVQAFDDKNCNYGQCKVCMDSMLVFDAPQPILEYDPTLCEKFCLHFSPQSMEKGE